MFNFLHSGQPLLHSLHNPANNNSAVHQFIPQKFHTARSLSKKTMPSTSRITANNFLHLLHRYILSPLFISCLFYSNVRRIDGRVLLIEIQLSTSLFPTSSILPGLWAKTKCPEQAEQFHLQVYLFHQNTYYHLW